MALQSRLYSLVARRLGGSLVGTTEPPQRIYLENLPCTKHSPRRNLLSSMRSISSMAVLPGACRPHPKLGYTSPAAAFVTKRKHPVSS